MKVGILTHYYKSLNYGGMLQAYALARYLCRNGYDVEQISYQLSSDPYSPNPKKSTAVPQYSFPVRFYLRCKNALRKRLVENPRRRFYENYKNTMLMRRADAFAVFRETVPHSCRIFSCDEIPELAKQYPCLITGSDQVWNFDWFNPAFFLDIPGCDAKRIAYAASAGKAASTRRKKPIFGAFFPRFNRSPCEKRIWLTGLIRSWIRTQ